RPPTPGRGRRPRRATAVGHGTAHTNDARDPLQIDAEHPARPSLEARGSQSNLAKRDPRRNHETRSVDDRRAPDVGPTAARPPGRSRTTAAPATPLRERAAAVTTAPAPPGKPRGCARRWRPTRSGPRRAAARRGPSPRPARGR